MKIFKWFSRFLARINWRTVLMFSLIFIIFFINTFHEEYPDEYDSIVGGKYILSGKIPYRDWFQHHQPLAYIVASLILPFSGNSFVGFRIFLAIFYFTLNAGSYFIVKKRFPKTETSFWLFYLFFIAFLGTYYWGQMLLADTLAAYLIVPAYALVILKTFSQQEFGKKDLLIVSLFSFLSWFTSMTFTYLLAGIYLFAFFLFLKDKLRKKLKILPIIKQAAILLITPYLLFFVFLLATVSIKDYYFANITYNQDYYIYNYPRAPGAPVNPIRYAIVLFSDFVNNFYTVVAGIKDFRFADPLNATLAVSNVGFLIYLLVKKRYQFLFPFLIVLVYANARSNPAAIKETDYQASVYILTSAFVGLFTFFAIKKDLNQNKETFFTKVLLSFTFLLLGIYWFMTAFFIPLKFFQKAYAKYMGQAPLIYNRPQVAPIINQIVSPEEYAWVGPFEFKELFYLKAKVPSKYHWFLNHAVSSDKMRTGILSDFAKNRATVIVFNRNYAPWGGNPHTFNYFFTDFLDQNYLRIYQLGDQNFSYKWKIGKSQNFDPESDFNFDRNKKEQIIQKLLEKDLIVKIPNGKK